MGKAKRYKKYAEQENVKYINKPQIGQREEDTLLGAKGTLTKVLGTKDKIKEGMTSATKDSGITLKSKKAKMALLGTWIIAKIGAWFWVILTIWGQEGIDIYARFIIAVTSLTVMKQLTLKPMDDWITKKTTGDKK